MYRQSLDRMFYGTIALTLIWATYNLSGESTPEQVHIQSRHEVATSSLVNHRQSWFLSLSVSAGLLSIGFKRAWFALLFNLTPQPIYTSTSMGQWTTLLLLAWLGRQPMDQPSAAASISHRRHRVRGAVLLGSDPVRSVGGAQGWTVSCKCSQGQVR